MSKPDIPALIPEEEETDPEKLKQIAKEREKIEKKIKAMLEEQERKHNLRKDLLKREQNYLEAVKDQVNKTTGFTSEITQFTLLFTEREHFWGNAKLNQEWKDFHCKKLLEDAKGRSLGEDFTNNIYLECFDQIMGSYQEIMLQMMNDFEFRRDRMLKTHWAFLKYAKMTGMDIRDNVRTVSYATADRYERKCKIIHRRQRKNRRKLSDKRLDEIAETAYDLETKAFNLWVQFRTVFGRFRKDWKIAKRLVCFLKLRDVEDRKDMAKQKKFLADFELMKQSTDTSSKSFWVEKNKELGEERVQFANTFSAMQYITKGRLKFDEERITQLSKICHGVICELERIKEKVAKVLNLKQLCFKLETEEEKVFPSEFVELYKPFMRQEFDNAFCVDKLTYRTALVNSHCDQMECILKKEAESNRFLREKLRHVLAELRPDRDIDLTMMVYNKDFP